MQETQETDVSEVEESDEVEITTPAEVEDEEHHVLHRQAREQKRLANKPYIDHLEDAISIQDGMPFFNRKPGDTVIIERFASVLDSKPWLDTRAYKVINIDAATGDLKLQDADCGQQSSSNYLSGPKLGYRFKIPEKKGAAALPRKNKAAPKVSIAEKEKIKADKPVKTYRIYSTKGVIHTRVKGVVYVPTDTSQAIDGMRVETKDVKGKLIIKNVEAGWEETWVINKDMK